MIQILTYRGDEVKFQGKEIVVNSIHDAQSLDEFAIDIICLQNDNLWYNKGCNTSSMGK